MRWLVTCLVALTMVVTFVRSAHADQPLSEYQQKVHDEVKAGLEGVEQSLADARAKMDAGDPAAASGAYNTAVRNYNNHVRRLGQLPADNASVAALRTNVESVGAALKETGAALKSAPAKQPGKANDAPSAKPAPPAASQLDYQQREKLKNAKFHLDEAESRTNRIVELTGGKLDAEAIAEANNHMQVAQQRMGYVADGLKSLPADSPDVAIESKRYNDLQAKLAAAQDAIKKAAPDADKQMAALGEQLSNDLAMVDSWSKSLGDPKYLFNNKPDDAVAVVGQLPQMRDALGAMQKRWTARATEKPNDKTASDMVNKLKYVDEHLTELEKHAKGFAKSLPEQITADLADINKLIDTAVTEKRPAYFSPDGGIAHQLVNVEHRIELLKAIDAGAGDAAEKSVVATRQKSRAAQKSLSQDIIKSNKKPAEKYAGADVEDLRKRVIAEWKAAHPSEEIVAVIFNTEGWSRTTRWQWNKSGQSFEKVDYDYIQPKLFYKLNDTHALEMPVDIYKDYMKDGHLVIKPWGLETEPPVARTYLLDNLK